MKILEEGKDGGMEDWINGKMDRMDGRMERRMEGFIVFIVFFIVLIVVKWFYC